MSDTAVSNIYSDVPDTLHPDLLNFIKSAIDDGDHPRLQSLIKDLHEADIAEVLTLLDDEYRDKFIQLVPKQFTPEQFRHLEPEVLDSVVDVIGIAAAAKAIGQLESDEAVDVIEDLDDLDQEEVLKGLTKEKRKELEEGLAHDEETAGRLMKKEYVTVPKSWNVGQVIDFLRKEEENLPQDFYSIYIVDREGKPVSSIMLSRILRNTRETKLVEIMEEDIREVSVNSDQEDVAYMFQKYGIASTPVVNDNGVMVGVITLDDVLEIIEEEAEEDILRMAGVKSTSNYYDKSAEIAHKRFPWLFVNLLTAILASFVIKEFDYAIEQLVALAVLMPIVASMAGNAGTQTLTVAVRGIATRELTVMNASRVLSNEVVASLINGLYFAVITGLTAGVVFEDIMLGVVFALAMLLSLVSAAFAGAMIPLALNRFGIDPAISSSVFLTTVTDIVAFFSFLGLAAAILI